MTIRTFMVLTLGAFFSLLIAMRIDNRLMEFSSYVLLLLPSAALIAQSEVK